MDVIDCRLQTEHALSVAEHFFRHGVARYLQAVAAMTFADDDWPAACAGAPRERILGISLLSAEITDQTDILDPPADRQDRRPKLPASGQSAKTLQK